MFDSKIKLSGAVSKTCSAKSCIASCIIPCYIIFDLIMAIVMEMCHFLNKMREGKENSKNMERFPSKPLFGTGSKWSLKFEKISDWSLYQRSRSLYSSLLTFSRSRSPWLSRSFGKRSLIFQFSELVLFQREKLSWHFSIPIA